MNDEILRSLLGQNNMLSSMTAGQPSPMQLQVPKMQNAGLLGGQNVQGEWGLMQAIPGVMAQSEASDKKGGLGTWGTAMLAVASSLGPFMEDKGSKLTPVRVGDAAPTKYSSPFSGQMASIMPLLMQYLGRR